MSSNYASENFGSGANVDVPGDSRQAGSSATRITDRYLLEYETIHADIGVGVNDDSVRVRNQQSASDLTVERDIRTGDNGPETMAQDDRFAHALGEWSSPFFPF